MARKRKIDPLDISIPKLSDSLRDIERHGTDPLENQSRVKKRVRRKIAIWHKQPITDEEKTELLLSLGKDKSRAFLERVNVERKRSCLYLARYPETGEKLPDELMVVLRILSDSGGVLTFYQLAQRMQSKLCPRPIEFVLRAYEQACARLFVRVDLVTGSAALEATRRGNPHLDMASATAHAVCPLCSVGVRVSHAVSND